MAGYSSTPLATKLGIGPSSHVCAAGAPDGLLARLLPDVAIAASDQAPADVILWFVTARAALAAGLGAAAARIYPSGALWVAWPKKAARVATDVSEDVVRAEALALGVVDNKVCAIDATWSGLRLVWRRERR